MIDEKALRAAESAYLQVKDGGFVPDMRAALLAYESAKPKEALKLGSRLTVEGVEAVAVPVEPDELIIDAIKKALRETRSGGVCGMTIDAQWRSECAREIAAYRAMLSAAGGR